MRSLPLLLALLLAGCATSVTPNDLEPTLQASTTSAPPASFPSAEATTQVPMARLALNRTALTLGIVEGELILSNPTSVALSAHEALDLWQCGNDILAIYNETGAPLFNDDFGVSADCAAFVWPATDVQSVPAGGEARLPFRSDGYDLPSGEWIMLVVDYRPAESAPGSSPVSPSLTAWVKEWVLVP